MGRSGNWKLDDRKLSRRKFISWRNEKFRDVNFPSRTTESCPDVNRPSRTRRVGIEDANIPSQVHPANRDIGSIGFYESSDRIEERKERSENLKKTEKT